jgi:hypothetical protein
VGEKENFMVRLSTMKIHDTDPSQTMVLFCLLPKANLVSS